MPSAWAAAACRSKLLRPASNSAQRTMPALAPRSRWRIGQWSDADGWFPLRRALANRG